ncbi:MAG TPA: hypothetical protein DCF33_03570 [Saprospirales bacterium]|nr:hypothetical protein [Saprospirales bacterium]
MKHSSLYLLIIVTIVSLFSSCSTLEKASLHGFHSGNYKVSLKNQPPEKVYVDIADDRIDLYRLQHNQPEKPAFRTLYPDSLPDGTIVFSKNSLDIDLTAVPLKYRPSLFGLPGQLTTDFNVALYAGWRHDSYRMLRRMDPLGRQQRTIVSRGYDFGVFAGPAAAAVSPFSTQNKLADEYTAMTIQTGAAGFIETNIASFGLAVGWDYLLNDDRAIWIYHNKPWIGFIVGVALN